MPVSLVGQAGRTNRERGVQKLGQVSQWRAVDCGAVVKTDSGVRIAANVGNILGEGPLWHPEAQCLFWFDILRSKLYRMAGEGDVAVMDLPFMGSAAGWIDAGNLLLAGDDGFYVLDMESGSLHPHMVLEDDNPATRSNDGRVDPWGRFWIGTMGRKLEAAAGALYRLDGARLEVLKQDISIPNSIAFSPDRARAYFADSPSRNILALDLNPETGDILRQRVFASLDDSDSVPDGSVVDSEGYLWNAQWGRGAWCATRPTAASTGPLSFPLASPRARPSAGRI
ncbi:SMP-30/gluconolactonase/LRE family protein [Breoghania sp. L-A4]|nr:SMP-30/gluconolactonase/LRE family protein [Breoghania sp. L-A4]